MTTLKKLKHVDSSKAAPKCATCKCRVYSKDHTEHVGRKKSCKGVIK